MAVATTTESVVEWAARHGISVVTSETRDLARDLAPFEYDWFFSIANLRLVPESVWLRAGQGAANFHDGPLPRYAGLNTPAWAILKGETQYGVTWHALTDSIDKGDIYADVAFEISDADTALTLNAKCFEAGMTSFTTLLDRVENCQAKSWPQPAVASRYFGLIDRPEGAATIDFERTTGEIWRLVRGLSFGDGYVNPLSLPKLRTPSGAYAVTSLEVADAEAPNAPGTVVSVRENGAIVAAADGAVSIEALADSSGQAVPLTAVLTAGDILPALDEAEAARLTILMADLARHEEFFRRRLVGAENPEIDGVVPASPEAVPEWEAVEVALPDNLRGDKAVAALVSYVARTGRKARVRIAYADDDLAALANEHRGYVAPSVPLTLDVTNETTVDALERVIETELAEVRRRRGHAGDLVSRTPRLAPGPATLAIRQTAHARSVGDEGLPGSVLTFVAASDAATLRILFDGARLPKPAANAIAAQIEALLAALASGEAPERVSDLPLISKADIDELVVARNRTARDYDRAALVHTLISAQAARTPDATALISGDARLTYRELEARADRVATTLSALGVGADTPVGLYVERSLDLVVGALAILKAGGAYVPLDPTYPKDRVALMIEDSGLSILLTQEGLKPPAGDGRVRSVTVEDALSGAEDATPANVEPHNLAYVIYTSGSTGRPKGVMVEHRNVVNFFAGMDDRISMPGDGSQPVWLAVTSLSFDISVLELFWTLTRGFAVVIHTGRQQAATPHRAAGGHGLDFSLYFWGNDDGAGSRKYQLLLEGARFADAHGFSAVWTPERHFHAFGGPYPNPSVTGAAVAAVTKTLEIRAGSCVLPLHHPARVAEEWAVIDNISNGRVGIAFASGWMPEDFLLRPENAPPHNKTALLRDIDVVRRLWRGEAVPFDAPGGKQVNVVTQPRPVSPELKIWVTTAGNPDTYREAARLGANVLTHLLGQSIEEVAEKVKIYRDTLAETGRNPDDYTVTLMLHTLIGNDREEVRTAAREPMKAYLRSAAALIKQYAWAFPAFKKPKGATQPMDIDLQSLDPDEMDAILEFAFLRYFDDSGLFGTVDDALARAEQVMAIGVNEIACLVDFGVPMERALSALEPLAEVVSGLKQRASVITDVAADGLADLVRRHGVTHFQCTPSMATMVLMSDEDREALSAVRHLFIGGEALQPSLVEALGQATSATVENMYGPTETTIWSSTGPARSGGSGSAPLGTPIANTQLYVLDDALHPVPSGAAGELYIGGDGVTRGYLGREDLTAERFLDNPFVPGGRIYRTGDLVRIGEDGEIHFLGRADHQVKVRGYRIELGEIEARLGCHPDVAEAVVVVREDEPNDTRIVTYVRFKGEPVSDAALKAHVSAELPDFMVPAHFVTMTAFPLTPNAKVDRKALPRPDEVRQAAPVVQYVAPSDDLEVRLADAFKRLLGVERVGASDNFFTIGGHSLLAVQLHRDLKANVAADITITDIYRFPTVKGLASHVRDRGQADKHLENVANRAAMRRQAMLGRRDPGRARDVS
ncbi:luciferase [Hyphomicrobium nitrativorans NL23]|uniref:Luciferase n=1 Tax=Hyphomicrobium nitrativorans NL23 TaxID=1029756 RepID=V5SAP8_9HYPH|nr:luciferase [Hyphomicrobium nitrativorans NL23]